MHAILIGLILTGGGSVEGTVTVKTGFAKNALVYIKGYATQAPKTPPVLGQSGRAFEKVVLPVVKRSRVQFTNNEPDGKLYHHVFSPKSKVRIDSEKYKPGGTYLTPELTYEGPTTVHCDIHKEMIATVYVLENDRYVLLDTAEGDKAPFRIDGIKPGKWKIVAWHRSVKQAVEREIEIVEGKVAKIDLVVEGEVDDPNPANRLRRMGQAYKEHKPDGGTWGEAVGLEESW